MRSKTIRILTASISHKHGTDIYVAVTDEELTAKIFAYVEEWWSDVCPDTVIPADMSAAIEMYFSAAAECGNHGEYINYDTDSAIITEAKLDSYKWEESA